MKITTRKKMILPKFFTYQGMLIRKAKYRYGHRETSKNFEVINQFLIALYQNINILA